MPEQYRQRPRDPEILLHHHRQQTAPRRSFPDDQSLFRRWAFEEFQFNKLAPGQFAKQRMHPHGRQPQILQQLLPLRRGQRAFQMLHARLSDVFLAQMPQCLHQQAAQSSRRRHVARRGAAQLDFLPPNLHGARRPVCQEHHLDRRRNCRAAVCAEGRRVAEDSDL